MAKAKKTNTGQQLNPIIQNLIIRPIQRTTQDIKKWRDALKAAESIVPRRISLYDLYSDILLDGHLSSIVEKRIMSILNTDLVFSRDNKPVDEVNALIRTTQFEILLREIMNAKFWGYSLIWTDFSNLDVALIPRKHVEPHKGLILKRQYELTGEPYRTEKYKNYLLEAGSPDDLGLFLKAAQYVIYKRGAFGDWAQFSELFGMPFRIGKYETYDVDGRVNLEKALDEAGSAAYAVVPKSTDIEFHWPSSGSNANGELYHKLEEACDEEMSVLILGQTMTTKDTSGSGYAQGLIHQNVEYNIHQSDRRYVLRILQEKLNPILQAHGYQVEGGKWNFQESDGLSIKDRLDMDTRLAMFVPISDDYFYEKYGIPKPDDYNALKTEQKKKVVKTPAGSVTGTTTKQADRNAIQRLFDFFAGAPGREPGLIELGDISLNKTAGKLDKEAEKIAKQIYEGTLPADFMISDKMAILVAKYLADAVYYGIGKTALRSKYKNVHAATLEEMQKNVYRFSAAKNYEQLKQINQALLEGGQRRSFTAFMDHVKMINQEFNRNYLMTEYNTSYSSAQMARKWNEFGVRADDSPFLKYRAVMDDRTRDDHAALNGVVRRIDDPFWNNYYPPNDWNCRCTVIQLPESNANVTDLDKVQMPKVPDNFANNSGKTRQIFTDRHPYVKAAPIEVLKRGESLK